MQQVVGVAEQPLCVDDLRGLDHGRFKVGNGLARHFAQGDKHHRGKVKPQLTRRQQGAIAKDHAGVFQRPHAPMARGEAQAHPICQFSERKSAIGLQLRKNISVNAIHMEEPSSAVAFY